MPAIDVGDPLPNLAVRVENPPGTLVNVGLMTLTITRPDGATDTPAVANPSTGEYTTLAPYLATAGGLYRARWVASGANACVKERVYSVGDPVDIDEVRTELKIAGTTTDDLLYRLISAATDEVERMTGRALRQRTVTDVVAGGKYAVALSRVPVGAVVSVAENGTALAPGDWTLVPGSGLLYRGNGLGTRWAEGPAAVTVTYSTSTEPILLSHRQAIVEIVRELVGRYRGSSLQPSAGDVTDAARVARQLVGARLPGFA